MDRIERCRVWNQAKKYQKVVDALEELTERSPEEDCELAHAYSNLADKGQTPKGRKLLRQAIGLLEPHQKLFSGDHLWNFRMGYAWFCLDREDKAIDYFEVALNARPYDKRTKEFFELCWNSLNLPGFEKNFRERTAFAWQAFAKGEEELRRLIGQSRMYLDSEEYSKGAANGRSEQNGEAVASEKSERNDEAAASEKTERNDEAAASGKNGQNAGAAVSEEDRRRGEIIEKCSKILSFAFHDPVFEIGFNGEKYELVLISERSKVRLFEIVYFCRQAPAEILAHWVITAGRRKIENPVRRVENPVGFEGFDISAADLQVWVEKVRDKVVWLTLYSENLLPVFKKNEELVCRELSVLIDQTVGEIPSMAYIEDFEVSDAPGNGPPILLTELPERLAGMGFNLSVSAAEYLEEYTEYHVDPYDSSDADWRMDIFSGTSRCMPLIDDFIYGDSEEFDSLYADGTAAGFLVYSLDGFKGVDRMKKIRAFRESLEETLEKKIPQSEDVFTIVGTATGLTYGYLDIFVWDYLLIVLKEAITFFKTNGIKWAGWRTFRQGTETMEIFSRGSGKRKQR